MTAWTTRHARLLAALDDEVLLPAVRRALHLDPLGSPRADRHLLDQLQQEPRLRAAMSLLEHGEEQALEREIRSRWPGRLAPGIVHHLALAWSRQHHDAERRALGLRGLVWLLDTRRDETARYLPAIVERALGGAAPAADHAAAILETIPPRVFARELAAIRALGTSLQELDACRGAAAMLRQVIELARLDGTRETVVAQLEGLLEDAARQALEHVIARVGVAVADAERRRVAGERGHLGTVFAAALEAVSVIGHRELLSIEVVDKAMELAWPLYQGREHTAVRTLLEPLDGFADDLAQRLTNDEAFGRQAIYADFCVIRAQTLAEGTSHERERVLRERRQLLQRSYALCPIHRNTRICLAGVDLELASLLADEARRGWRPGSRAARLDEADALVREAAALRPEHSRLAEVKAMLESVRNGR